jgi:hypothetical protein
MIRSIRGKNPLSALLLLSVQAKSWSDQVLEYSGLSESM